MSEDIYRGSFASGSLPTQLSSDIMQKMQDASAVMRLARKIELPGAGLTIPVITADPEAAWTAETDKKPVSKPGLTTKIMSAYKLAVVVPFSNEFRRDASTLYSELARRLPAALANKFDKTVVGAVSAPGANFDRFNSCTKQNMFSGAYASLVAADADIADHDGILNGFALAPKGKGVLLAATDTTGRPLFINSVAEGAIPQILGAPTYQSKGVYTYSYAQTSDAAVVTGKPYYTKSGSTYTRVASPTTTDIATYYEKTDVVGIAGDWTQALYGTVEGINVSVSDQATLTYTDSSNNTVTINLWQQNMFALRAEIEIGFRADTDCFNLLTNYG